MKSRRTIVWGAILVTLAMMLLASGCGTPALQNEMSYQGRLTDAAGNPITGLKNMTFRLYTTETGGTPIWEEAHSGVQVTGGLFNVVLGETTPLDEANFHQPLYLEVVVDDATLAPRQKLLGAPYAFSLVPGAVIKGSINATETYSSTLNVANFGDGQGIAAISASGHGIYVESGGGAAQGAALWAENTSTNGIAIWADNESSDTTLVVRNKGTGPLIKGFGGDGGEDELRVNNNGSIESKADSYVWIGGTAFETHEPALTFIYWATGAVEVTSSSTGDFYIKATIPVPAVLYGQNVTVEQLRVNYRCENSASYIDQTRLEAQTGTTAGNTLVLDETNYTSTSDTAFYTLNTSGNNKLNPDYGVLCLQLKLHFASTGHSIWIGGVRLRLGHHHLY